MNRHPTQITRRQAVKTLAAGTAFGLGGFGRNAVAQRAPAKSTVRFLNRNGVKLAYAEAGRGEAVVLIHGWGDSHESLQAMIAHYGLTHRAVALDLRGHGRSDKPKTGYAVAQLADDAAWVCQQLKIKKPVIIGHSLGGSIALEIAARYPMLPKAIVALDGVILSPAPLIEATKPLGEALKGPAWLEAMRGFVAFNFLPTDDPALKRQALQELETIPQHVHIGVFEGSLAWDAAAAARACKVPTLYVESGLGLSDLEHFKRLCPQLVTGKTVGVGHNQMVATPQQVNAMIDRFKAING